MWLQVHHRQILSQSKCSQMVLSTNDLLLQQGQLSIRSTLHVGHIQGTTHHPHPPNGQKTHLPMPPSHHFSMWVSKWRPTVLVPSLWGKTCAGCWMPDASSSFLCVTIPCSPPPPLNPHEVVGSFARSPAPCFQRAQQHIMPDLTAQT